MVHRHLTQFVVRSFLAKLEEAKSAASLFESARHWKAGDTALLRLKPLITQMTTALDVPYARLLAKCGSAAESVRPMHSRPRHKSHLIRSASSPPTPRSAPSSYPASEWSNFVASSRTSPPPTAP